MEPDRLVRHHTVYSCVVGSRAYGLHSDGSDTDRRGVYLAPTELFWRLAKPPTHVEGPDREQFSWELERFCVLALESNPTVLECLWSPLVERATAVGQDLRDLRSAFLSVRAGQAYGGYAKDQLGRLTGALNRTGTVRWKQAMHMVRLLLAGAHVLRTGEVLVDVSDHRDRLLAVRRGEVPFADVQSWAAQLGEELDRAALAPAVPAEPDRAAVDDFLVRARRGALPSPTGPATGPADRS